MNQLNYIEPLPSPIAEVRPDRLSINDQRVIYNGTKQILFGTRSTDVVEVWITDAAGTIVFHDTLSITDPRLSLATTLDTTGAYEFLNIDLTKILADNSLESGRYGLTLNFFRHEVGSEFENTLYITDISKDRTELRLYPKKISAQLSHQIYEWVVPSVPKVYAQALIDQTFGKSIDFLISETVNIDNCTAKLQQLSPLSVSRLHTANAVDSYELLVQTIIDKVSTDAVTHMKNNTSDFNIQETELLAYITKAIQTNIQLLQTTGQIDPRFDVY